MLIEWVSVSFVILVISCSIQKECSYFWLSQWTNLNRIKRFSSLEFDSRLVDISRPNPYQGKKRQNESLKKKKRLWKWRQIINNNIYFYSYFIKSFTGSVLKRWKLNWCDLWIDGSFVFYKTESRRDYEAKVNLKATCVNVKPGLECPSRKELFQPFNFIWSCRKCMCRVWKYFNTVLTECLCEQMYVHLRVTPERICWLFFWGMVTCWSCVPTVKMRHCKSWPLTF